MVHDDSPSEALDEASQGRQTNDAGFKADRSAREELKDVRREAVGASCRRRIQGTCRSENLTLRDVLCRGKVSQHERADWVAGCGEGR